jgi:uncharacterized protein YndB with AHSA1/START domain
MIDVIAELAALHRDVVRRPGTSGEEVCVEVRRTYPTTADDLWDAITDPKRLARWFLPVTGELGLGGTFQLEGNAGGEILGCEPPELLRVSWGSDVSIVEIRLGAGADRDTTELVLRHSVPIELAGSGAGALWVGPGWDAALLALGGHVRDDGAAETPEFSRGAVQAWADVVDASGTATTEEIAGAVEISMAQFGGGAMSEARARTEDGGAAGA